jgi:peptide/nickel transport system substrate-binding protein
MQVVDDQTKKRLKEQLVSHRAGATEMGQQADDKIDRLLIRRFSRLVSVRRFVLLWTLLFVLLSLATALQLRGLGQYYQALKPVPGGLYNEGIIGTFTNANPLYANGAADTAVSRLVFSSLFKYDDQNRLVGDLAKDYTTGSTPNQYTVHLKTGIKWQDGTPFTADDVVFTYRTIQNIEAQSSLYSSWQGITVTRANESTVVFALPNPLTAFPYSLTNGIVPAHLLSKIPVQQLRSASFNTSPVGTGPFIWKYVDVSGGSSEDRQQHITLAAYKDYYGGRSKLDGFSIITFTSDKHLIETFKNKQLNAISGLQSLPSDLAKDKNIQTYVTPMTSAVMAFFNNSHPGLSDPKVRQALASAVDSSKLSRLSNYPVRLVDEPLLHGQLGYDKTVTQLPYNLDYANQLLDQAGWVRDAKGYRAKAGQPLGFTLLSQDSNDYVNTASFLQQQWAKLGVKVDVNYRNGEELQSSFIANHSYDVLLYGINIGVDPDVYAYWDSSQASVTSQGHLNLSEYKSASSDQALEAGRTRSDPNLRAVKYKVFLTNWHNDAPAVALYQPNFIYITRGPVFNYQRSEANTASDRFYNVDQWMIRQKKQNI